MRELVLSKIEEYLDFYDMATQYAILHVLNVDQVDNFIEFEDLLLLISEGSDDEVLNVYDIFSTPPADYQLIYGVPDKYLKSGFGDLEEILDKLSV